jgi:general secretion pathway protein G
MNQRRKYLMSNVPSRRQLSRHFFTSSNLQAPFNRSIIIRRKFFRKARACKIRRVAFIFLQLFCDKGKTMYKFFCRQEGFTVVEMIAVLAVIAVLAGTSFGFYRGYVDRGKITRAKMEIVNMQAALDSYYTLNDSYPSGADLEKAGLPLELVGTDGTKAYTYGYRTDSASPSSVIGYVLKTSRPVGNTGLYVYGAGSYGSSDPPEVRSTVPSP